MQLPISFSGENVRTFIDTHHNMLFIFLLSLCIRLLFATPLFFDDHLDMTTIAFDGYYQIAENLMIGNGFSHLNGDNVVGPTTVRTPLYPLIIAGIILLTGSYKFFLFIQILVSSLVSLVGYRLASMITKGGRIPFVVGVLLAIEPLGAWFSTRILTETFFTFFFLIFCVLFLTYLKENRTSQIFWCALLLGLTTLIKPSVQFLPVLLVGIIIGANWRPTWKTARHVGIFLVVFYLVLSPWMYRNHHLFGTTSLNIQGSTTLYGWLVPSTIALEQHITFAEAQKKFMQVSYGDIDYTNASYYKEQAIQELVKHPVGLLKSLGVTVYAFFVNDGYRTVLNSYDLLRDGGSQEMTQAQFMKHPTLIFKYLSPGLLFIIASRLGWLIIALLAFWGMLVSLKKNGFSPEIVTPIVIIGYLTATTAVLGLGVDGRYRNPINVFIFTFALIGILQLRTFLSERYERIGTLRFRRRSSNVSPVPASPTRSK